MTVPEDVRPDAERRIDAELHKQHERTPQDFASARDKLNFCNPADYIKLIVPKNHGSISSQLFRRKVDVERQMEAFSEFRNAIMHDRPFTEIVRRAGELALVWFGTVLPTESDDSAELTHECINQSQLAVLLCGTIDAGGHEQFIIPLLFCKHPWDVFNE
jgi:hypothetical protein